jgi:3-methylcrotonyl-CoA carboxylase alpha subunit
MITGLDLVEWQLRVAAGEPLPLAQSEITMRGHAIEARIYAEDPSKDFLPSIGRIKHLATPSTSSVVRIDTGVAAGDEISPFYDPMLAKLIVWGEDRDTARKRLRAALAEYQIVGLATNVEFLHRLVGHAAFAEARLETGLIERHRSELFPVAAELPDRVLAIAALAELQRARDAGRMRAAASAEPDSPWYTADGWWLNADNHQQFVFAHGGRKLPVTIHYRPEGCLVELAKRALQANVGRDGDKLAVNLDGERMRVPVIEDGGDWVVFVDGAAHRLARIDPLAVAAETHGGGGHLLAPMPGAVVAVLVKAGDTVSKGAPILVLEAMKMEHTIVAPASGRVAKLFYRAGEQVPEGAELVTIESAPSDHVEVRQ